MYKNTNITEMISTGTDTFSSNFINFNYKKGSTNYDCLDASCGILNGYLINSNILSNEIQVPATVVTSTGTVNIPSWADSFKIYITTAKGSIGNKGATGQNGNKGATGQNGNKGATGQIGNKGATGQRGAGERGNYVTTSFGARWDPGGDANGGDGGDPGDGGDGGTLGPGGDGGNPGDGGDGIIAYTERLYIFNNKKLDIDMNSNYIDITADSYNIRTNIGQRGKDGEPGGIGKDGEPGGRGKDGEPGGRGQNGYDGEPGQGGQAKKSVPTNAKAGQDGAKGAKGATGDKGAKGATGDKGQDGAPGDKGQDGAPGAKGQDGAPGAKGNDSSTFSSVNLFTIPTSQSTNSIKVYFFAT